MNRQRAQGATGGGRGFVGAMVWIVVSLGWTAPPVVQADASVEQSRYESFVQKALREASLSNWAEAFAMFKLAHEERPGPRPLRGMAFALFELKRYTEAADAIADALRPWTDAKPLTQAMRDELVALQERTLAYVVPVRLLVEPADADVYIDGMAVQARELRMDEGTYLVQVRREGYHDATVELRALTGRAPELSIHLVPLASASIVATSGGQDEPAGAMLEAQPGASLESSHVLTDRSPSHVASWTLIGAGAAGLVTGGILAAVVKANHAELATRCPGPDCDGSGSQIAAGRRLQTVSNLLMFGGAALALSGLAVRVWVEKPDSSGVPGAQRAEVRLAPFCNAVACTLTLGGRL